jgi:hypothetical protein
MNTIIIILIIIITIIIAEAPSKSDSRRPSTPLPARPQSSAKPLAMVEVGA